MRLFAIGVLAAGVTVGACDPAAAATRAPRPMVARTAAAGTSGSGSAAVTTASPRDVTIPAGTRLAIVLDTAVGSDTSHVEEAVQAHLARPLSVHGVTVLGEGSRVSGVVTNATRSAKVKGRAHVAVRFNTLTPRGDEQRYAIRTASVGGTAPATKEKDALEIAGPAAGGAIIGALVGGKKGALIGTAAGGGAGTAVVLSTRGKEIHLNKGAVLTLRLSAPVTIRVRG